jgi:hypothetical protein
MRRVAREPGAVRTTQRGASFVAVLFALLIVAFLYFGYFKLQSIVSEQSTGTTAIDATRTVACRTNRQVIERTIAMWSIDHPGRAPTLADLASTGLRIPPCPGHGQYELIGREVRCTVHR